MMELLLRGQTYLDTKSKECQDSIVSLAKCLQITVNRLEKVGKIRVRSMNELLNPSINNNNIVVTDEDIIEADIGSSGNVQDRCQEVEDADGGEVLLQTNLLYADAHQSQALPKRNSYPLDTPKYV